MTCTGFSAGRLSENGTAGSSVCERRQEILSSVVCPGMFAKIKLACFQMRNTSLNQKTVTHVRLQTPLY